ncbi:nucleoside triphosphate pyrophosphohydrolase [Amnibacterium flavum]|uniref:Nucleoside triphosphate pyrophosphohydrolase n=2 Tax=Amnibacterium flavum TaxID=2173173 RepID=A0A2V1HT38_9MICO|nr:nucleoside triphosphate pyrophosphohydrolase [Amnibacterium flavum]
MHRLRRECAWDAEQTHESLVPYLIEESAELVEAIELHDVPGMREELGDVLYQVLFHADLAASTAGEGFDIDDVAAATAEKMRLRHPHVFAESDATTTEEITLQWDAIKKREKSTRTSVLDGIPRAMPSLALAGKMLGRAAPLGVEPEPTPSAAADEAALGRQLLGLAVTARANGWDAERALRTALRALEADVRAAESSAPPLH